MRVYLSTFGCRANQYDTESVRAMLLAGGCEVVPSLEHADTAVFNSCAVTAEAEADLRQSVRRAARSNPRLRTVVMGCAAALDRGAIRSLPGVTDVLPGADLVRIAGALGLSGAMAIQRATKQTGTRALLRIQDGCDEHCTFCATTIARGAARSRPPDELVTESRALAEHHSEIVLTGVHIGAYGTDIGCTLGALLTRLVRDVPRVRYRLSSIEATEVDACLGELLTRDPARVAPYLHAPLQSGSSRVLKRMGRHWYSARTYADAIARSIGNVPVFGLGADVIAGFPGETLEDHAETVSLIESLPFTALHVFPYSVRPGTSAERLPERVPGAEVARRASELRSLAARKADTYRAKRAGGEADVIVIGDASHREGLTEDYLCVSLADRSLSRGARVRARLELNGIALSAHTIQR